MTLGLPIIGLTLIVHVIVIIVHKTRLFLRSLRAEKNPPAGKKP